MDSTMSQTSGPGVAELVQLLLDERRRRDEEASLREKEREQEQQRRAEEAALREKEREQEQRRRDEEATLREKEREQEQRRRDEEQRRQEREHELRIQQMEAQLEAMRSLVEGNRRTSSKRENVEQTGKCRSAGIDGVDGDRRYRGIPDDVRENDGGVRRG